MNLMRHRGYLRALTPTQRRSWLEQRKRLTPRVSIGSAWLPNHVRRSFVYTQPDLIPARGRPPGRDA